jgi:transposase
MIPVTVQIFVYREPIDMRRGFDGLALIARDTMGKDPRSGTLFIFANRRADKLKALWWERNGYCLLYKRLHRSLFVLPAPGEEGTTSVRIDGKQLVELLAGVPCEDRRQRTKPTLRLVR